MISLSLAKKLKEAGLSWTPSKNDFFAIPDRGLDDSIFVINEMTAIPAMIRGQLAVTFHGSVEWALDHVMVGELVWLPTETQLRELLEEYLIGETEPTLMLVSTPDGYHCEVRYQDELLSFEAFGVSEVYGLILLDILKR